MAMKKKPKPLVPDKSGTRATVRGEKSTRPVRKITKVGLLKKPTLKNLTAPKGTGSGAGAGSVRVITKSETFMKQEKQNRARRARSGSMAASKPTMKQKDYTNTRSDSRAKAEQRVKNTPDRYGASFGELKKRDELMRSAQSKGNKPSQKITPKKKTPPVQKPPVRRPGLRGFGGGGMFGFKNK